MRRDRKNNIRRERIIMIASSAFVLAALTMTGVYMKDKSAKSKDDGYTIDFTEIENNVDDKYQEIVQNAEESLPNDLSVALGEDTAVEEQTNMENDLDYMPMEAGSHMVEIPGLTDGTHTLSEEQAAMLAEERTDGAEAEADSAEGKSTEKDAEPDEDSDDEETAGHDVVVKELHFSEEDGLLRPTTGEVLMPYSMDAGIYFATLDQYKYNPAVVFAAEEGNSVNACAEARVADVYEDAQIGHAVTLDLGDGYQVTYGQLREIQVKKDSYVNPGDVIGSVAAPTKYYSVEGTNLYFKMTKDGEPVNPEGLF